MQTSISVAIAKVNARQREQGAVLLLVCFLIAIFFAFAALAIDLSLVAASREQTQHHARLASLAALEAHFSSKAGTLTEKVADAMERAQSVVGKNLLIANLGQTEVQKEAHLSSSPIASGAYLEPGVWQRSDDGKHPCQKISQTYPCFTPTTLTDPNAKVTAYRITGQMYQGISTKISRWLWGVSTFPVNVRAVASVVPRQGCFLVDMSLSATRETHVSRRINEQVATPREGRGRESSFLLETENPAVGEDYYQTEQWNYLCHNLLNDGSPHGSNCTGLTRPLTNDDWNAQFGFTPADLSDDEYNRIHFADDYRWKKGLGDGDYDKDRYPLHPNPASDPIYKVVPKSNAGRWYHVDTHRDTRYQGAEPLRTIFAGLNRAVQIFEDREVAGDKLCLVFYNSRVPWTGVVKPTDDFEYLKKMTTFDVTSPIDSDPPGISSSEVGSVSATGFERMIRHNLIPSGTDAFSTNTILALSEAMKQLLSINPDGSASGFVISIGDAVVNCQQCFDPVNFPKLSSGCTPGCSNTYPTYLRARQDLYTYINFELTGRNIPVHWLLVGRSVAPHTIEKTADGSPLGPCLSDEEARKTGTPMVEGGYDTSKFKSAEEAFNEMSPDSAFWEANVAPYEIAAATQGLFGPIRPASPTCVAKTTCNNSGQRILEDPGCRVPKEQIDSYVDKILGENPFALVQVSEG